MSLPDFDEATTWMAATAILALILSQFPPVLPRLVGRVRGSTVLLSTGDTLGLTHHLGRFFLVLHVQVENTGPAPLKIAKIDCVLRRVATGEARPSRAVWRLPARTYYAESGGSQPGQTPPRLFIGTISLKPDENWQEVVHCYGSKSDEEEKEAQDIQDRFAQYIARELEERNAAGVEEPRLIKVNDDLVHEARQFAERMFDLTTGEYELFIAAVDRKGNVLGVTKNKLILYESMIALLRSILDEYQYGFGVWAGAPPYKRAFVEPRLTLLGSDQVVRREYRAIADS